MSPETVDIVNFLDQLLKIAPESSKERLRRASEESIEVIRGLEKLNSSIRDDSKLLAELRSGLEELLGARRSSGEGL